MNWIQHSTTAHWRPVLVYVAFAAIYIVFSSEIVVMLPLDPSVKTHVEIAKGLAFVAVSAWAAHRMMSSRLNGMESLRSCLAAAQRALASRPGEEERIALGALAHEMKNVVFVASLNAACLQSQRRSLDQQEQCARDLRDALNRLTSLTRELSDRVAKNRPPALQTFEVSSLVQKCADMARMSVAGTRAEVDVRVRARGMVEGDKAQIEHAIVNLMTNAVQATEGTRPVRVTVEQRDSRIAIIVADHGPGLSEAAKQSLFRLAPASSGPFPAATSRSGVGLILTRRIARMHGGDVRLCSSSPHGAVFELELPTTDASAKAS